VPAAPVAEVAAPPAAPLAPAAPAAPAVPAEEEAAPPAIAAPPAAPLAPAAPAPAVSPFTPVDVAPPIVSTPIPEPARPTILADPAIPLNPGDLIETFPGEVVVTSPLVTPIPDQAVPDIEALVPPDIDPIEILARNILRDRMAAAGRAGEQYGHVFQPGEEAHHVVAANARAAAAARGRLTEFGIDVNDPVNGVALPGSFHRGIHTEAYYRELNRQLELAQSRDDVIAVLRDEASRLSEEAARGNLR
jgi:hypothetical protein